MKVHELISILKEMDPEAILIVSKDEEGNDFSPLAQVSDCNVWSEEEQTIGLPELTPEYEAQGYGEEDVIEGDPCIVLWPSI